MSELQEPKACREGLEGRKGEDTELYHCLFFPQADAMQEQPRVAGRCVSPACMAPGLLSLCPHSPTPVEDVVLICGCFQVPPPEGSTKR